jgi:pantothenate kinase
VKDSIEIGKKTGIVILEGSYVNLDREPWRAAAKLFDLRLTVRVERPGNPREVGEEAC